MPLQAQLIHQMRAGSESHWPSKLRERMLNELPQDVDEAERTEIFSKWSANTNYCYRFAETTMTQSVRAISARATGGRINEGDLNADEKELLALFAAAQDTWQQVCLVLRTAADSGSDQLLATESVVLNRPLAKQIDLNMGMLLVRGEVEESSGPAEDGVAGKMARAFGDEAAVYWGGPNKQRGVGLCVHGIEGLPGSAEVAPGMRIYTCSGLDVEACADQVLEGKAQPLDFRWFVGRHGALRDSAGEWGSVACARPIALKQCLGLPKPLWHEVMELCGGEYAQLSRLELLKRDDLTGDEEDDEDEDEPSVKTQ